MFSVEGCRKFPPIVTSGISSLQVLRHFVFLLTSNGRVNVWNMSTSISTCRNVSVEDILKGIVLFWSDILIYVQLLYVCSLCAATSSWSHLLSCCQRAGETCQFFFYWFELSSLEQLFSKAILVSGFRYFTEITLSFGFCFQLVPIKLILTIAN